LRLFGVKDRKEFAERYFELSPEFQPDGSNSKEKAIEYLTRAFDEGSLTVEWMHQTLDGTLVPSEVKLVRVLYGNDFVVAGYTRDLREHKQMMEIIRQRDKLLSTGNRTAEIMLGSAEEGIEVLLTESMGVVGRAVEADRVQIWRNETLNGEIRFVHTYQWLSEVGKQKADVPIGLSFTYSDVPEWENRVAHGGTLNSPLSELPDDDKDFLKEYDIKSIVIIPLFINESYWGFFSLDDCVNERAFTDDEINVLRSTSLMMANAINRDEQAEKLREAHEDAKRANNAKSEFLAKMSHEMRTPLNAVIGLSEMNLDYDDVNCETCRGNLEKIYNAGKLLLNTVNDILDISKIEAGKMELVTVEYSTPSVINDTVTQNSMLIGEKKIELILDIDETMFAHLHGDELRVRQILNNLLSNAIKYTREGRVILSVKCVREHKKVRMNIKVSATGIGIRPQDIDKLFTDYTQLDAGKTRRIEGTGLGLPLTKKLVDMMDGSISVISEYGKGSVFNVSILQGLVSYDYIGRETAESLKNLRYADDRRDRHSQLDCVKLPNARVLIVDDIPTNLDVARGLLKPYGMQADTVLSGRQAIAAVKKQKYDAIFMDQMMPDMDGLETARRIREIDAAANTPIIALTANAISGNEEIFINAGFADFLTKPIDSDRLDEVIRKWIGEGTVLAIDMKKGLAKFGGDEEIFLDVLRSYAFNTPKLLEAIKEVTEETLTEYATIIHGIKGSSRGIKADAIGDKAEELERAAKSGDFKYVISHNEEFLRDVRKLILSLNEMIIEKENAKPKKEKPNRELLLKLHDACNDYDMDGVDDTMAELEKFKYESDGELVLWLRENVSQMNFKEIVDKLWKI
jgi:signal transduction histidine kinase/DNA-binding NarL/FixJ family response regulator